MIKAVVFDMDGVIFDTEQMVLKAWKIIADKYGIPDIEKAHLECLGLNQQMAEERFRRRYGEDFPYWDYKAEMRAWFFGPLYGEHLPIKEGALELLQALKQQGIPVALATSTRQSVVMQELADARLTDYFDKIVCGDMVSHSKPHPEIFLRACEELGVAPEDAFVIEDSYNGIRAAYAGGLRPIMVPDMMEPDAEMERLCFRICSSLTEVKELFVP